MISFHGHNSKKLNPMRTRPLAICLLAALLSSCVGTSLKQTWKSPDYHNGPVSKIAALAVDERGSVRSAFESRFVLEVRKHGISSFTTFDLLSLPDIKSDKAAAAERLRAAGADSLLILRLVDSSVSYREVLVDSGPSGPYNTWYDYYAMAYGMSQSYGNLKQSTLLETSIFDLKTNKRIWSGLTETVTAYDTDRVAEMDKVVAKVAVAMKKDGIIP
jgi:hypothetical protein